jgi:hypothetical protein
VQYSTKFFTTAVQLDPQNAAASFWECTKVSVARRYSPVDAFNHMYHHHLVAQEVQSYGLHPLSKKKIGIQSTNDQEQYLTLYEPLVMEKWAVPLLRHMDDRSYQI